MGILGHTLSGRGGEGGGGGREILTGKGFSIANLAAMALSGQELTTHGEVREELCDAGIHWDTHWCVYTYTSIDQQDHT